MPNLREQLDAILPIVLPKSPHEAVNGTELLKRVKGTLSGNYSDDSIRQSFSLMAADPTSPIAKVKQGHGYYLRTTTASTARPISLKPNSTNSVEDVIRASGWNIVETLLSDGRNAQYFSIDDLPLSEPSRKFLHKIAPKGIYQHQKETIRQFLQGENVCMTTGTASGKSLSFQVAGIEQIVKDASAKIIAIYPMKALGREQTERWEKVLESAGLGAQVGVIDGNVPRGYRLDILRHSRIVVFTPDIIHAWLLSNLTEKTVRQFLRKVALIVVDEVHTYTGVFGSHSAFLFRRLQHLLKMLGAQPQYICASATIADPQKHLRNLFGLEFRLITKDSDTSPKYPLNIHFCNPPSPDLLTEIVKLIEGLTTKTSSRFVAFADSRKQVELIASILARPKSDDQLNNDSEGDAASNKKPPIEDKEIIDDEADIEEDSDVLDKLNVLPYRAGYEESDRNKIQQRLSEGKLSGVISTSALELGIDIPHLNTCILVGVPKSATSLQQRIGRVGRHAEGNVLVINTGDVYDQAIFANPSSFLNMPLAESALYLDNVHIQYIHALCLARMGGEHDQVVGNKHVDSEFFSTVNWPGNFIRVCNQERSGQLPRDLQSKKAEAGDNPNYAFPLRDVESQLRVEHKMQFHKNSLGSLSYRQLMREAYPGAIYYYATEPYRVYRVNLKSRLIQVKKTKKYTTKPQKLPTQIFPNLTDDNVFRCYKNDELVSLECNLQVSEFINGFIEKRGPTQLSYSYPLPKELGFFFDQPLFTRNFFTSGVIITHPALENEAVRCEQIAELLFEAFLLLIPFEKQDLDFASDKFRVKIDPLVEKGKKFIAIYDQTYGSLRLSGRLLDNNSLLPILREAKSLSEKQDVIEVNAETMAALEAMAQSAAQQQEIIVFESGTVSPPDKHERIIMPDSKGLLVRNNQDFWIKRVFYTPDGLRYEGFDASFVETKSYLCPLTKDVIEIPGESRMGLYNYNTGQVEELAETIKIRAVRPVQECVETKPIDTAKLHYVLHNFFDESEIAALCGKLGIKIVDLGRGSKADKVKQLILFSESYGWVKKLLVNAYVLYKQLHG